MATIFTSRLIGLDFRFENGGNKVTLVGDGHISESFNKWLNEESEENSELSSNIERIEGITLLPHCRHSHTNSHRYINVSTGRATIFRNCCYLQSFVRPVLSTNMSNVL